MNLNASFGNSAAANWSVLYPPLCGIISNSSGLLDSSTYSSNFATLVFRESHYDLQILLCYASNILVSLKLGSHYNLPIPLRYAFGIGVSQKFLIELSAKED